MEGLLGRYLNSIGVKDCSCTVPYENLASFSSTGLFSTLVVVLSPRYPYAEMSSLVLRPEFDHKKTHFVFPEDLLNRVGELPRETQMYMFLGLEDENDSKEVEQCIIRLISIRMERQSCFLLTNESDLSRIVKEVREKGKRTSNAAIVQDSEGGLQLVKLVSGHVPNRSAKPEKWVDSDSEELEEEQ